MSTSVLQALVGAESVADFRQSFPRSFLHRTGSLEQLGRLGEIEELQSLPKLLAAFHDPVSVWFPDEEALDNRSFGKLMRSTEALPYYERGALLQMNQVERWIAPLESTLRTLERELDVPPRSIVCSLFTSTTGGRVLPHFDTDPAFSVQLAGSKRWWVSPQSAIEEPLNNYVCGTDGSGAFPYHQGSLPDGMPSTAEVIEMVPGSVLFLPRGYLHATQSHAHSSAVTFDIQAPCWAAFIGRYVTDQLTKQPAARRQALESLREPPEFFSGLLAGAEQAIQHLRRNPADLERVVRPGLSGRGVRTYERTSTEVVVTRVTEEALQVMVAPDARSRFEIELSSEFEALCRWLVRADRPFTDSDVMEQGVGLQVMDMQQVVNALVESDALRILSPAPVTQLRG